MTTQNWPDPTRPGVPMFPERDGKHLFALGGGFIVAFWRTDKQWLVCDDDHDLGFCASERAKYLDYIGPVLTPMQINEMLAAERERCAVECDKLEDDFLPCHPTEFARAIRNLGAAQKGPEA